MINGDVNMWIGFDQCFSLGVTRFNYADRWLWKAKGWMQGRK